jgi:hypothetical protein
VNRRQSYAAGFAAGCSFFAVIYLAGGRAISNAVAAHDWDRVERATRLWFFFLGGPRRRTEETEEEEEEDEEEDE